MEKRTSSPYPAVDRVVKRCLEKRADERFQSSRDVAFALEAGGRAVAGIAATRQREHVK